jgi:hypothetical protein
LNISPKVLSKITASVYAQHQNRKINIGLRIKFTRKGQQMLGYTQRIETPSTNGISRGYWMYSAKALDLVYEFMQRFPDLFQALEADDAQEIEVFSPEMLFPNGNAAERMTEVEEWLKNLETNNLQRVPIGSKAMPKEAVKTVEEESNRYVANNNARKKKTVMINCQTNQLLTPLSDIPATDEESTQMDIPLGERVMNLRDNGPIPFGLKGTVTGIVNNLLEVVFDEEFLGGTNLGNRCSDLRGQQHIPATTVLNLGRGHGAKRGGRNSGPQQNAWAAKADREQQGPRGQSQGQGQQAPHQHHQQQPRPNRGGQGADKPVTILSSRGGGGTEKRDVRKSGDKVAYRPKPQPQGEDGAAVEGATQPAPGKKERSRKNGSKPSSLSSSTGSSGSNNGQSTEEEVAEYWNKLQSQHSEPAEGEAAGTKPRRERRRGGGKRNAAHPVAAEQHASPQPAGPTLLPAQGAAPAYPLYYYQPAPNFPPQPYMMPPQYPGVPPAAALYGGVAMPLAGAGPTAAIPIPGLPVPLQVPLQPAMAAAPLNWQQQELVSEGAKKPPRGGRGGRGRGRSGGRGGYAGGDGQQPPQQQWQEGNPDDATAASQQQQQSRQRRGRGGRNRPDRDGDRQEQPQKDQKDQLTWQQKMLL